MLLPSLFSSFLFSFLAPPFFLNFAVSLQLTLLSFFPFPEEHLSLPFLLLQALLLVRSRALRIDCFEGAGVLGVATQVCCGYWIGLHQF